MTPADLALLRADCARCTGLCCVAPTFVRSAEFALDKPAGVPCPNLLADHRCGIHDRLPERGFAGCVTFDCFGAGQAAVARGAPSTSALHAAFWTLRDLHELRWYVAQALSRATAATPDVELVAAGERLRTLCGTGSDLADVDTGAEQRALAPLLTRVSTAVRTPPGPDLAGRDLAGRDLRARDLRRATLRGAALLGADLRGAGLDRTDLLGADLRGADLRGADVATALFLTLPQLRSARTDATTRLPAWA